VGTNKGLELYKDGKRELYRIDNLLPIANVISSMDIDPEGNLWCGDWHSDLAVFKRNTWHVFHGRQISDITIYYLGTLNDLLMSESSGIWALYSKDLLRYFDGEWFSYAKMLEDFEIASLSAIAEGPDGSIWVGASLGIFDKSILMKWDGEEWESFQTPFEDVYEGINCIEFDNDGNLWLSSSQDLYFLDGRETHSFGIRDYTDNTDCSALTAISDGTVWAGYQSEIFVLSEKSILKKFTREDGLPIDPSETDKWLGISEIKEAPDGSVWVVDRWGISQYDGIMFKPYYFGNNSFSVSADLAVDKTGRIFISSSYGITEFTPTSVTLKMNLFAPGLMYKAGDMFSLSLNVNNYGPDETGDLYFVMMTPDGRLYSGLDWSEGVRPAGKNITIPEGFAMPMIEALKVKLPVSKPPIAMPGKYYFALALADTGTTYFRAKAITSIDVVE